MTKNTRNVPPDAGAQPLKKSLLIRVVFLAVWILLVDLWLARHFRVGLSFKDLSMLFGVPLGSLIGVGFIDFLLGREKRESFVENVKDYGRNFVTTHVNGGVIAVLYIGSAFFAAIYTTVSIDATKSAPRDFVLASLTFPDQRQEGITSTEEASDIHIWMNPFAPDHLLSVKGYLPQTIQVKPFLGALVVPERDLIPTPTILFRPDFRGSVILRSGGWFQLYRKKGATFAMITEDQGQHARYVGPRRNQPRELWTDWQLEMAALGFNEQATAMLMRLWRRPRPLQTEPFGPNEILCGLIINGSREKYISGTVIEITRDEYIDLSMGGELNYDQENVDSDDPGAALCSWLDSGAG